MKNKVKEDRLPVVLIIALILSVFTWPQDLHAQSDNETYRLITPDGLLKTFRDYCNLDPEGQTLVHQLDAMKTMDKNRFDLLFNAVLTIKSSSENIKYNDERIAELLDLSRILTISLPPVFAYYEKRRSDAMPPEEVAIVVGRMSDIVLQSFESKYLTAISSKP